MVHYSNEWIYITPGITKQGKHEKKTRNPALNAQTQPPSPSLHTHADTESHPAPPQD